MWRRVMYIRPVMINVCWKVKQSKSWSGQSCVICRIGVFFLFSLAMMHLHAMVLYHALADE